MRQEIPENGVVMLLEFGTLVQTKRMNLADGGRGFFSIPSVTSYTFFPPLELARNFLYKGTTLR